MAFSCTWVCSTGCFVAGSIVSPCPDRNGLSWCREIQIFFFFFSSRRLSYICNLRAIWSWYRRGRCCKDLMQETFLLLDSVSCSTQFHDFISHVLGARLELVEFAVPVNVTGARLGVQDLLLEGQVVVL